MRLKSEDLAVALTVLGLMPKGTKEQLYWNIVHRLDPAPGGMILKTTDGGNWIEWRVAGQGPPPLLGANVDCERLESFRLVLPGGSFDLVQDVEKKRLTFHRHELFFRLPYTSPDGGYPDAKGATVAATWSFQSKTLAAALNFAHPFVETKGNSDKTCMTLYGDGTLTTGTPKRMVQLRGVCATKQPDTEITHVSFNAARAKLVANFLSHLGADVKLVISRNPGLWYEFKDPTSGNRLVVAGENAQFKIDPKQLDLQWTETSHVDRKTLLRRAKAFTGLSPNDGIQLTFKGEGLTTGIHVATMEEEHLRCSDEWLVFREFAPGKPVAPTTFVLSATGVIQALSGMSGTSVAFQYDGRLLKLSETIDVVQPDESDPDAESQKLHRSVIFPQRRRPQDADVSIVTEVDSSQAIAAMEGQKGEQVSTVDTKK